MDNFSPFAKRIYEQKYLWTEIGETKWEDIAKRTTKYVLRSVGIKFNSNLGQSIFKAINERKFIPGGRYLYASGRDYHQVNNCLLTYVDDSREGWSEHLHNVSLGLMTGAGIGTNYSRVRPEGKLIRKTGGLSTGPCELMKMTNECGRGIVQGGSRRAALWAGLNWSHQDIIKFINLKNWSPDIKKLKEKDFNFSAPLDMTNISVQLDDEFFVAFHNEKHAKHSHAQLVYWITVEQMCKTGEPGFSIDVGINSKETTRNACAELTSGDDSDICNLGSINLAKVSSLEEMKELVEISTAFLLAGTVYSHVPYAKVDVTRQKNRRLGLGLMGVHEFLLNKNQKYGMTDELKQYLDIYATSTEYAHKYADQWELSKSVKTRALAPTGTIGLIAETTQGIEPIFCAAYKRRYLKHTTWASEYLIDPITKKFVDNGQDPDTIEDAYILSADVEKRIKFQADIQKYVDHAISSTINMPAWGSDLNNESTVKSFGNILMKYLPELRGITVYPDGAREGQILTPVKYSTAVKHTGEVFYEQTDICDITKGGTCGS